MKKKATKMDWVMHKSTKPVHLTDKVKTNFDIPNGSKYIIVDDKSILVKYKRQIYFILN